MENFEKAVIWLLPQQKKKIDTNVYMLLKARESFVLVIDVQEKLAPAVLGIDQVEKNLLALLTAANR